MKQRILLILFVTIAAAMLLPKALHAQQDTITVKTDLFDNLLWQVAKGQATQRTLDTLQAYYREAVQRYDSSQQNLLRALVERDTANARIIRLRTDKRNAQAIAADNWNRYTAERNKRNKAWGIGISAGYNPFTRLPMAGISLNYNLIRFSLRGLFTDGQGVEVQDPNIRIIK